MNVDFTEITLKGGSLNKTTLRTFSDGRKVVRKSVSRDVDREYGFVRWHSQFKRQQRYNMLFPGLFPVLTQCGIERGAAFLEMDYVEGAVDLKTHLQGDLSRADLVEINSRLWGALDRLHGAKRLDTFGGSLALYFEEEVVQRLKDACDDADFKAFAESRTLSLNGSSFAPLISNMDWFRRQFGVGVLPGECYTHGNVTLENILYVPATKDILFIDPYEENVVDCREAEYSQILQCSKSLYGFINDRDVTIQGDTATFDMPAPSCLSDFNDIFINDLHARLNHAQMRLVLLFEASQFVRMLPFKVAAGQLAKAKYFYCVASELVSTLQAS